MNVFPRSCNFSAMIAPTVLAIQYSIITHSGSMGQYFDHNVNKSMGGSPRNKHKSTARAALTASDHQKDANSSAKASENSLHRNLTRSHVVQVKFLGRPEKRCSFTIATVTPFFSHRQASHTLHTSFTRAMNRVCIIILHQLIRSTTPTG